MKRRIISMLTAVFMTLSVMSGSISVLADDTVPVAENSGNVFGETLNEKAAEQQSNDYGIISVDVNGNTAVVKYWAKTDCTVLIGIYEDDGNNSGEHMLSYETAELKAGRTEASVTLKETPPKYFYLKAYLIDTASLCPVASEYKETAYTRSMKKFLDLTVDDFPEERTWNLDENRQNNFMVVADGVKVINKDYRYDECVAAYKDYGSLTLTGAVTEDSDVKALKKGDAFMFFYSKEEMVINGIVESVERSDGSVTVTYSKANEGDLFEIIKINTEEIIESSETSEMSAPSENSVFDDTLAQAEKIQTANSETVYFSDTKVPLAETNENGDLSLRWSLSTRIKLRKNWEALNFPMAMTIKMMILNQRPMKKMILNQKTKKRKKNIRLRETLNWRCTFRLRET